MNSPFILSDKGDVALFKSVEDLERYVESPDVASYRVFDASGQVLHLRSARPTSQPSKLIDIVPVGRVALSASGVNEIAELESILRDFLARSTGRSFDRSALPELLADLQAAIGFTR